MFFVALEKLPKFLDNHPISLGGDLRSGLTTDYRFLTKSQTQVREFERHFLGREGLTNDAIKLHYEKC